MSSWFKQQAAWKSKQQADKPAKQQPLVKETKETRAFVPRWRTQLDADGAGAGAGAGSGSSVEQKVPETLIYWLCTCWKITLQEIEQGCRLLIPDLVYVRPSDLAALAAEVVYGLHSDKEGSFYIGVRRKTTATPLRPGCHSRIIESEGWHMSLSRLHLVDRRCVNDLGGVARDGCLYFTGQKRVLPVQQ